jgi:hypothetical protein
MSTPFTTERLTTPRTATQLYNQFIAMYDEQTAPARLVHFAMQALQELAQAEALSRNVMLLRKDVVACIDAINARHNLKGVQALSKRRDGKRSMARHELMWMLGEVANLESKQIARLLDVTPSAIVYGRERVITTMQRDGWYAGRMRFARQQARNALGI